VEFGGGVGDEAELRGGGLADEDSAGRAETGDVGRVPSGEIFLEDERAVGGGPAGGVLNVLYEDGDAGEEAGVFTAAYAGVDLLGLATRTLGVEKCQRVELGVGDGF